MVLHHLTSVKLEGHFLDLPEDGDLRHKLEVNSRPWPSKAAFQDLEAQKAAKSTIEAAQTTKQG